MAKKKRPKKHPELARIKNHTLPYVQAAVFCDSVLEDKEGTVSVIRIGDRFVLRSLPKAGDEHSTGILMNVLIMLKSGDIKGTHPVILFVTSPSGKNSEPLLANALFEGGEHGVNIKAQLPVPLEGEGLYWGTVQFENEIITRMPMRIVYPTPESNTHKNEARVERDAKA